MCITGKFEAVSKTKIILHDGQLYKFNSYFLQSFLLKNGSFCFFLGNDKHYATF